jgi:hypothetical protein
MIAPRLLREHVDNSLHLIGRLRISVTQVLHPVGDLIGAAHDGQRAA